jgi:hypothetical protein
MSVPRASEILVRLVIDLGLVAQALRCASRAMFSAFARSLYSRQLSKSLKLDYWKFCLPALRTIRCSALLNCPSYRRAKDTCRLRSCYGTGQAIFSAFLGRSNENVHIWRTVLDKMTATERQADPVTVHFGPNLEPLEIVDGPSALGYLFSIAQAPASADWKSYRLPLLLCFSKCLYLAFIINPKDSSATWSTVQIMANIMYLTEEVQLSLGQ